MTVLSFLIDHIFLAIVFVCILSGIRFLLRIFGKSEFKIFTKRVLIILAIAVIAANLSFLYQRDLPTPFGNVCGGPCYEDLPQGLWPLPYTRWSGASSPWGSIYFEPLFGLNTDWMWSSYFLNVVIFFVFIQIIVEVVERKLLKQKTP